VTAAEWMFEVIKEAFAFSISAEFFDTLRIGYLLLLNKGGITLSHLARNYFELRHWVWIVEEAAVCMRAHCASAKQSGTISTKQMNGAIFFSASNCIVVF
jgi:hypothetical protein